MEDDSWASCATLVGRSGVALAGYKSGRCANRGREGGFGTCPRKQHRHLHG
jgi:hypothetical protein